VDVGAEEDAVAEGVLGEVGKLADVRGVEGGERSLTGHGAAAAVAEAALSEAGADRGWAAVAAGDLDQGRLPCLERAAKTESRICYSRFANHEC